MDLVNYYIALLSGLLRVSLSKKTKDLGYQEKALLLYFSCFRKFIWSKMINFSLIIIIRGRLTEH